MGILIRRPIDRFIVWGMVVVFCGAATMLAHAVYISFSAYQQNYVANDYYSKAREKLSEHDYKAALDYMQQAIGTATARSFRCHYYRSIIYTHMGDLPAAMADIDTARSLRPRVAECYHKRARLHLMNGNPGLAIADLDEGIPLHKRNRNGDGKVWVETASVTLMSERPTLDYAQANYLRGIAHYMEGDRQAALADFASALETSETSHNPAVHRMIWCATALPGGLGVAGEGNAQARSQAQDQAQLSAASERLAAEAVDSVEDTIRGARIVPTPFQPWDKKLCEVLTGKLNDEDALLRAASEVPISYAFSSSPRNPTPQAAQAWTDARRCEAYFYSAARQLATGNTPAARDLLRKCIATKAQMTPEYAIATQALAQSTGTGTGKSNAALPGIASGK